MSQVLPRHFTGAYQECRRFADGKDDTLESRVAVVGPGGSGKTTLLRTIEQRLQRQGVRTTTLESTTVIDGVPREHVVIADDLHLLEESQLDALSARAFDQQAGLLVATRPWPTPPGIVEILRSLESTRPTIVLEEVARSAVTAYIHSQGLAITDQCVDSLLRGTGGIAWLMTQSLIAYGHHSCGSHIDHDELMHSIAVRINHRLSLVDEPVRAMIERLSLGTWDWQAVRRDPGSSREHVSAAFAEGLALRDGILPPLVRSAARRSISTPRLVELGTASGDGTPAGIAGDLVQDPELLLRLGAIGGDPLGAALAACADALLDSDPRSAGEMYRAAAALGSDGPALALREALAAWSAGELDTAARIIDGLLVEPETRDRDDVLGAAAAIWAARGMMTTASELYASNPRTGQAAAVQAQVAHAGAGATPQLTWSPEPTHGTPEALTSPTTLGTAMRSLDHGLRASLERDAAQAALSDLVQASELYTSAGVVGPMSELPAVIGTIVAVGAGDLTTAAQIIGSAVEDGQGGIWARRRLLLWQAWLATQSEDPARARQALERSERLPGRGSPRDEFLRQVVIIQLARRYRDLPTLQAAWDAGRESTHHVEMDLYTLLPLGTLIDSASRLGDSDTLAVHLARGLDILDRLGEPPLWSAHLRWAGIQQGILLNAPETIAPHARALVAMSGASPVARKMADAGRVWVSVLSGSVDTDAVEAVARELGTVGLAWDGARMASHAARRTNDRKDAARLLACARDLHPQEQSAPPPIAPASAPSATPDENTSTAAAAKQPQVSLSRRELDVAHLILQGKTYAEIGDTIYISPRTVEHHVARIRRRLSATSRSDLVAKLRIVVSEHSGHNGEGPNLVPGSDGNHPSPHPQASGKTPMA